MWRAARGLSPGACKRVRLTGGTWEHVFVEAANTGVIKGAWRRVIAFLVSNFFGFCRSKAIEDHGIVSFLKLWADLHRSRTFGVDFPRFCRLEVDGSSGGIGFVKFFLDLRRLE